jgi:FkbM family methyltransferase
MKIIHYVLGRSFTFDPRNSSLGGSEQAIVRLSEEWSKLGYNVFVYADPCTIIDEFILNDVSYLHSQRFREKPANKQDVIILWRQSGLEEWVHYLQTTKKFETLCIDLHDEVSKNNILVKEFLKERKAIFCLKSFDHSKMLKDAAALQTFTFCNGLDICNLNLITCNTFERIRHRFCWTSSYERGLKELLTFSWPKIKHRIPNAELHIFYGFQPWHDFTLVQELETLFCQDGIVHHGRVSLQDIRDEKLKSFLWLYPCTSKSETDCINIRESAYLDCIPVVSNASVLKERPGLHVLGEPTTREFHDSYVNEVIRLYSMPECELEHIRKDLKAECNKKGLFASWKTVAEKWDCVVFKKRTEINFEEQIQQRTTYPVVEMLAKTIHFVFGNCFPFSPLSAAENRNSIPEAELLSISVAERLAHETDYNVTIFADKDSIGPTNDGVFVNKVWYKNLDSLFSLQELDVVILHGYSGIHTWRHLRRLNLPKKMICVYISGDLSAFDSAFPTSFKMLQNDNALFCLEAKNQLHMKFCKQLSEKEICFIEELTHVIENPYFNTDHVCKVTNYHKETDAFFKVFDDCIISEELRHNRIWEAHLHSIFDKYITPDSTVVEVGCHIGSHSVKLSKLCKFLYCFEPMPTSNALLLKNLNLNSCKNVKVFLEGLSKTKSKTFFQYSMIGNIGASSLAENPLSSGVDNPSLLKNSIQSSKDIEVNLITLDSLCLESLDFMKIDVEGYEPYVLEGANKSIKKFMPIIVLESYTSFLGTIDFEFTKNKFQSLIQLGYKMQHIEGPDYLFIKE